MFIRYCLVRFIVERTTLEFERKTIFDFHFTTWKNKKRGSIGPKILKQLPQSGANQVNCEVLSLAKDPSHLQKIQVTMKIELLMKINKNQLT